MKRLFPFVPKLTPWKPHFEGCFMSFEKTKGWSSFYLVQQVQKIMHIQLQMNEKPKIGHCGTLDPMATGLMILAIGKATTQIDSLTMANKTYRFRVKLGESTPSYDATTPVDFKSDTWKNLTLEDVANACKKYKGKISQTVPIYSAVHVKGQRLYKIARNNENSATPQAVTLPIREVFIDSLTIEKFDLPYVDIRVTCSKGTYVRSIAHEIGIQLGCYGHAVELVRTHIAEHGLDKAWTVEDLSTFI